MSNIKHLRLKKNAGKIFLDKSRFKVVCAGRRFGKTRYTIVEIIDEIQKANKNILYIAPTNGQAYKIFYREIVKILPREWILSRTKSPMEIIFKNGTILEIAGGEAFERFRGNGYDLVIFDETADIPKEAFYEVIMPSLATTGGRVIFIGTPKGINNWFYDLFNKDGYACYSFTTSQGGWVPEFELEEAKSRLTERQFKQEYEASFESESSLVYECYSKLNDSDIEFSPNKDTYLCWDFNVNPMSCVIVQDQGNGTYVAVKEFVVHRSNTTETSELVYDYLTDNGFTERGNGAKLFITGDKSGEANKSSATRTDYQIIQYWFKNFNGYKVFVRRTPSIRDRVASLNLMFKNAKGDIKMFVNKKNCPELIKDFLKVEWDQTHRKLDGSDSDRTHISDALSYFALNFHPSFITKSKTKINN